jgi:hypothetical protein
MFYYTRHFCIFCIVFLKYIPEGLHEKAIGFIRAIKIRIREGLKYEKLGKTYGSC